MDRTTRPNQISESFQACVPHELENVAAANIPDLRKLNESAVQTRRIFEVHGELSDDEECHSSHLMARLDSISTGQRVSKCN